MVEGDGCFCYKVAFDSARFYGSAEHSGTMCNAQGAELHCLAFVDILGAG